MENSPSSAEAEFVGMVNGGAAVVLGTKVAAAATGNLMPALIPALGAWASTRRSWTLRTPPLRVTVTPSGV